MRLSAAPIALDELIAEVASPARGGTCLFMGTVRSNPGEEGSVVAIEYSAYWDMAEVECERIVAEVRQVHPEARVAVRHRLGRVSLGEASLAVVAAAPHRAEAFAACRAVIEEVKRRLPVWKRELHPDGTAMWVDPQGRPASAGEAPR